MSAFTKRKPRIIQTFDDDEPDQTPTAPQETLNIPIKFGRSKPAKSSSLRKSININSPPRDESNNGASNPPSPEAPVVIRPSLSRTSSTRAKKPSRLSFGPDPSEQAEPELSTPKKPLSKSLSLRKSASLVNLPTRFVDDARPSYTKESLSELASSTPNTPQPVHPTEMDLDMDELEGALIVPQPQSPTRAPAATILSEAEIRERKDRRSRLAHKAEIILLDSGSDSEPDDRKRITLNFKKKKDSRLIAEDEDLGEGYDDFVTDGSLTLSRKAERDFAQRQRQEMADLIQAAEDGSESDDSEAERKAAYEAAQRRAGMDGLKRDDDVELEDVSVPRMKPLPEFGEVLARMKGLVQGLETEARRKRERIAEMEREREEILKREAEVQGMLDEAGGKYQSLVGEKGSVAKLMGQSPMRVGQSPLRLPGITGEVPTERGLESFGTPTKKNDEDEDEEMI
ncbi:hypothetical protein OQA88_11813 [Cercophora sp. LCS_1]